MNKAKQILLKALSSPDSRLDVEKSRKLMNLKALDPLKPFYRTLDTKFYREGREIPLRIYFPDSESYQTAEAVQKGDTTDNIYPVLLYIHGGGFVTESVDSYSRVCRNLAKHTRHVVVAIDYPLAPEHRFPTQVEDCYAVAKAVFADRNLLNADPDSITIMGDSAGGNLTAAVTLMARDRGEFAPPRQILIYPCVNNNYRENNGFASLMENGQDYLLTRQNMADYLDYYQSSERDRENPYFAPLLAEDFTNLPKTLIITGEFDPLRDEGEAFAAKLAKGGNQVEYHRIADGIHGFFLLETFHPAVKKTYEYINEFLETEGIQD